MPDVEQSKMVDIDTSGPGADVELENDQPEENTSPEVETSAEEYFNNKLKQEIRKKNQRVLKRKKMN
jgi:hypothetical protein